MGNRGIKREAWASKGSGGTPEGHGDLANPAPATLGVSQGAMWIEGIAAIVVLPAFVAAIPAFLIIGVIGSMKQHRFQPIQKDVESVKDID